MRTCYVYAIRAVATLFRYAVEGKEFYAGPSLTASVPGPSGQRALALSPGTGFDPLSTIFPDGGRHVRGAIPLTVSIAAGLPAIDHAEFRWSPDGGQTWSGYRAAGKIARDSNGIETWRADWDSVADGLHDAPMVVVEWRATNVLGTEKSGGRSGVFTIDNTPPTVAFAAVPYDKPQNAFSAKIGDTITLTYAVMDNLSPTVTTEVEVLSAAGDVVRTLRRENRPLSQVASFSGTLADAWDGRTKYGLLAEDGIYRMRVRVLDQAGNETGQLAPGEIILDNTAPQLLGTGASPAFFTPAGDTKQTTTLFVAVRDNFDTRLPGATLTVEVRDRDRVNVVHPYASATNTPIPYGTPGPFEWDGAGVPDGRYNFRVVVKDFVGNTREVFYPIVRGNVPVVISAPLGPVTGGESGLVPLRGEGVDVLGFVAYTLSYAPGGEETLRPESDWAPIPVPAAQQATTDPAFPNSSRSVLPVQNDGALGQWDTRALANGAYTLRLRVLGTQGRVRDGFQHVTLTNQVYVLGARATSAVLRAGAAGEPQSSVAFDFEVTRPASTRLEVRAADGAVSTISPLAGPAGPRRIVWDGMVNGQPLAPGRYTWRIVAEQPGVVRSGSPSNPELILVDATTPPDASLSVPVNSQGWAVTTLQGNRRVVAVTGQVGGTGVQNWRLDVTRAPPAPEQWAPVAAGVGAVAGGGTLGAWDVTGLEDGSYLLALTVVRAGAAPTQALQTVVLNDPMKITDVSAGISPASSLPTTLDPTFQTATIRFTLSDRARVTVQVHEAAGTGAVVATLVNNQVMEPGSHQVLWGKGGLGVQVAPGSYKIAITASDLHVANDQDVKLTDPPLMVGDQPLTIIGLPSVDPQTITPADGNGVKDEAIVVYQLSRPALMRLAVSRAGQEVRQVSQDAVMGANEIRWDGRDSNGALVAPDQYILTLRSADGKTVQKVGSVVVEAITTNMVGRIDSPTPAVPGGSVLADRNLSKAGTFFNWRARGSGTYYPPVSATYQWRGRFNFPATLGRWCAGGGFGVTSVTNVLTQWPFTLARFRFGFPALVYEPASLPNPGEAVSGPVYLEGNNGGTASAALDSRGVLNIRYTIPGSFFTERCLKVRFDYFRLIESGFNTVGFRKQHRIGNTAGFEGESVGLGNNPYEIPHPDGALRLVGQSGQVSVSGGGRGPYGLTTNEERPGTGFPRDGREIVSPRPVTLLFDFLDPEKPVEKPLNIYQPFGGPEPMPADHDVSSWSILANRADNGGPDPNVQFFVGAAGTNLQAAANPHLGQFVARLTLKPEKKFLELRGAAGGPGFATYRLEFSSAGVVPEKWTTIKESGQPVSGVGEDTLLGFWDITGRFGDFVVALSVTNTSGQVQESRLRVTIGDKVEKGTLSWVGTPFLDTTAIFPPDSLQVEKAVVGITPVNPNEPLPNAPGGKTILDAVVEAGLVLAGPVLDLHPVDPPEGLKFNPNRPVALVYKYEDAPGVNPAQLGIYRINLDGTVRFMDGLVDELNKTITVDLDSFSLYAAGVDPRRPKAPVVEPLVAQTSTSSITIRGTAEVSRLVASVPLPPSRVVVAVNDRPAGEVALAVPEGVFPPTTAPFELPTVPLDEGLNVIKVMVVNPRGLQSAPSIHQVLRDSRPPRVMEVRALPSPTLGASDGPNGQVTLRALMDEAGLGRWTIENAAGITVAARDVLTVNQGGVFASELLWDGKDSAGQPVPDGIYTVTFHGQDAIGNPAVPALVSPLTLLVDRTPPHVKSWAADRAAFGGSGAPRVTFTAAIEDISVEADGVFAVIVGPDGKAVVPPLPATRISDGVFRFVWDGAGPQGDIPEGTYPVEVDVVDRAGNLTRSSPVTVHFQRKRILDVQAALAQPLAVSPNGDGIQDVLEVGFTLLVPARVQARIEGTGFQAQILPPIDLEAGAQSVRWTATQVSGQPVPDGTYVMVLEAQTSDGQADGVRLPVQVDTVAPELTVAAPVANQTVTGAIPVRGAIKEGGAGLLQYRVSVKGSDPIAEPTVTFSTNAPVGNLLAVWESTPGAGAVEIRVTAQDRAGNVAVTAIPVQLANPDFLVFQTTVTGALVFSPDGDGHDDQVTLPFEVLEHTAKFQAQVLTPAGVTIRSLLPPTVLSEGPFGVIWDGRSNSPGQPVVADGEYQIEVRGEVDPGPATPTLTAPLVVVRRYPVLVVTGRPHIDISMPAAGATVVGMMEVTGSVSDPTGGRYEVRLGTVSGTGIVMGQGTIPAAGNLARVDTHVVRDGAAWLTLRAFNAAGADASRIVPLRVVNDVLDVMVETPRSGAVIGGVVSLTGRVHPTVTGTYDLAFTRGTVTDAADATVKWSPVADGPVTGTFTTMWDTLRDVKTLPAIPWPFGTFEGPDVSPLRFPGWTVGEPTIITSGDGFARAELVRGSGLGPVAEGQEALGLLVEAGNCCGSPHEASGAIAAESESFFPVGTPFTISARLVRPAPLSPDFGQVTVAARFEVVDLTSQQTVTYHTEAALQGETWTTLTVPMTNHVGHRVKLRMSLEETSQGPVTQEGFSSLAALLVDAVKGAVLVPVAIEGPVTLRLRVTSADGRTATVLHPLTVDNTPPTVVLNAPASGSGVRGVVALNGKIGDPHLTTTGVVFVGQGGSVTVGLPPSGAAGDFAGFWDTDSLDGSGVLRVQATDAAGNVSTLERTVVAQNRRPHLQVVSPVNSQRVHGTVEVQASAAGPGLVDLVLLAGQDHDHLTVLKTVAAVSEAAQLLFNWDTRTQPEGIGLVEIRAQDARGEVLDRRTIFVVVDNQPPTLKDPVLTPPGFNPLQTVNNQQRIAATLTEPAVVAVEIRSADGATLVRSLRAPSFASMGRLAVTWDGRDDNRRLVPVGAYRVVMRATDLVGQASELAVPTRIGVDDIPPVTQAVPEGVAVMIGGQLTGNLNTRMVLKAEDPITSAAVSGVKEIRVAVDGEAFRTYVIPIAFTSSGLHSVMFQAVDQAGNVETPKTVTINIDTAGPQFFRAQRVRIQTAASSNILTPTLTRTADGVAMSSQVQDEAGVIPNGTFETVTSGSQLFSSWRFSVTTEPEGFLGFSELGRGSVAGGDGVAPFGDSRESARFTAAGQGVVPTLDSSSFIWPGGQLSGWLRGAGAVLEMVILDQTRGGFHFQEVLGESDWKRFEVDLSTWAGHRIIVGLHPSPAEGGEDLFVDELRVVRLPSSGTVETDWVQFPQDVRLVNFLAGDTRTNGTITYEFSVNGQTWRPVAALGTVQTKQVKFRARLARTDRSNAASPRVDFFQIDGVRPLTLDQAVLPAGPQALSVVASEDLQATPTLKLRFRDGTSTDGQLLTSEARNLFRFQFQVPDGPSGHLGKTVLALSGQDLVGNLGESTTTFFVLDATPPRTVLVPSEPLVTAEGRTFLRSAVTLGFQSEDPVVAGFAAGVAETRAAVDPSGGPPGAFQVVTQPLTISAEGRYTLRFQSEDQAGNVEPLQAVKLEVDNTAPTFAGTRTRRVEAETAGATLGNLTRVNGQVRPRTKTLGPVPNGDFEATPFLDRWTLVSGSAEPGGTSADRVFDGIQSVRLRGGLAGSVAPPGVLRSAPFVFGSAQGVLRIHAQPLTSFNDFAAMLGERPEEVGSTVITLTVIDVEAGIRTTLLSTSLGEPDGSWGEYLVDAFQFQGRQIQVELTVETQSGFSNAPVSEVLVDAVQDGAFVFASPTASLLTEWVPLSAQTTGLRQFQAFQTEVNGTIQHFFSTDGTTFRSVSDLAQADVSSRRIRFRSDFMIANLTLLEGPALDAVKFEEILAPRVSPAETKTGEAVQIAFPVSEPLRSTPTVTLAVADGSTRLAAFTTQTGLDFVYTYTVQPQDPNGLAAIKIAARDRAGNVGKDTSLHVKLITDQEPPVTLVRPDVDLYPDGAETFARPVTFTLTAIDPGRELVKFDFNDPALQGQPDPRWRVLSGTWKVEDQAYRGLAGINEEIPTIRALSVTDHFTDYVLHLTVEDELAGEDTSAGVLVRAQEATPGQVTGGYAVRLSLTPGRGDGGDPGRISLWKITGSTSAVRLGGARLPQPSAVGNGGARRKVPVTLVLQGHRIRVAPHGMVVLDVTDPAGPLEGHLGLEVTAAGEGGHAARFDDIRLLDLSDLTVASGVTVVETMVASTPTVTVTPGATVTVAVTEPGPHTLAFHAVDAAGNAEPSRTLAVIVDTIPPALTLTQTTPEFVAAGPVAMTVTASEPLRFDPAATVNGRAAGAAVPAQPMVGVSYRVTAADAEGPATLVLEVRDRAGNLTTLTTQPFEVDRTPPTVVLQAPLPATLAVVGNETESVRLPVVVSEPATVRATITGPAGGTLRVLAPVGLPAPAAGAVAAVWDGRDGKGVPVPPGAYAWAVEVVDRAGNVTTRTSADTGAPEVVVDAAQALLADVALPEILARDPAPVSLSYRPVLPSPAPRAVRLAILRADGGVVRTLLPRPEDAGVRGQGTFTEIWDGRDAANQPLSPGGYWLRAELEDANPVLRAFAVVLALGTAVTTAAPAGEAGPAVRLHLPDGGGAAVTREGPRTWLPQAVAALGRVRVGGVRAGGEIRLLTPADDLLATRLPLGDGIRVTPEGGLPPGAVLQVRLSSAAFGEQVALYRLGAGDASWQLVAEQVLDPTPPTLMSPLSQGGLYAVLRVVDQPAPVVAAASAPPAFSPTGDGRLDTLPVTAALSTGLFRPVRVTLQVKDASSATVHARVRTRLPGRVTETWPGLQADGRAQPDGRYGWSLAAENVWRSSAVPATGLTILDTRPPETATSLSGVAATVGHDLFLTPATKIVLTAMDPLVNGVASGVTATTFQVDQAARTPYTIPFTLPEGRREVRDGSEDLAGNVEPERAAVYLVDGTAPRTVFTASGPVVNDLYVSTATRIMLTPVDPPAGTPPVASGVETLTLAVDTAAVTLPGTTTFFLAEGVRTLTWQAQDRVKNLEAMQAKTLRVDGTAPRTTLTPSSPFVVVNGETFARADTTYTLTAVDPEIALGIPGSGVAAILYRVDGSSWQAFTSMPVALAEGRRVLEFTASDQVGNTEAVQTITIAVDGTPPVTTATVGSPQDAPRTSPAHAAHPILLIAAQTPVTLAATDPLAGAPPVAAGVTTVSQRITPAGAAAGSFTTSATSQVTLTLAGRPDGDYQIEYQAADRVANQEALKSLPLTLDATPPVVQLLSPAPENAGVCQVVKGTIPVVATITDRYLATYRLEVAAGANATSGFMSLVDAGLGPTGRIATPVTEGALTIWDTRGLAGWQTLRLIAQDLVLNMSTATLNIFVGDPALTQTLGATFKKSEKDDLDDLDHPEGVAIAPDGTRWVADSEHDRLLAFTTAGALLRVVTGFHEPQGIAVLHDNTALWVADRENSRLVKLTTSGQILQTVGRVTPKGKPQAGSAPGEFNHPGQVAVDAQGRVYVADRNNHRWQRLKADGSPDLVLPLPLVPEVDDDEDDSPKHPPELEEAEPFGIAVTTAATRVYVSEEESGQVFIYAVSDTTAALTGALGGGPGTFKKPQGLATTRQNHVYVAERNANQVRKYDRFGNLVLVFGTQPGPKTEEADDDEKGKKMAADPLRLFKPTAVAVGPNGELAVAVRNDDGVKIFDAPVISTAGGRVGAASSPPKSAPDLSALGPPHEFAVGPNPARAGAPVNVYFVTGWSDFETEVRVYTAAGELFGENGGAGASPAPTRPIPWGSPAYAPGRYAVAIGMGPERDGRPGGRPYASGVYLVQIKVRNPDTGEVVPMLKKFLVVR